MNLLSKQRKGFIINSELAEILGLLEEYMAWKEGSDHESFCIAFEEKFGIFPETLQAFDYEHSQTVQDLTGFEWETSYVLFEDYQEGSADWEKMIDVLEEEDINVDHGSWAEFE